MADRSSRRGVVQEGDRLQQQKDDPDRRSRHDEGGRPPRGGDRNRGRDYRGRGEYNRDERNSRDHDRRRYRSRSPRDNNRDRDVGRDRRNRSGSRDRTNRDNRDIRDLRDRNDGRSTRDRRDRDDREPQPRDRDRGAPKSRGRGDETPKSTGNSSRDHRRRSTSPQRRSPSPILPRGARNTTSDLPTRSKVGHENKPNATVPAAHVPMSFKVGGYDDELRERSFKDQEDTYENRRDLNEPDVENDPDAMDEDEEEIEVEDEGMAAMQAMMGFGGFDSTKGKKVIGNNVGAVRKEKKTEYRQYMNRQGGFNRPLSPSR